MAAEQDEHRNKRARAGEEKGSTSTLSAMGSTSGGNVQPGSPTLPRGPLSNHPFVPNSHDSGDQASNHSIDGDDSGGRASHHLIDDDLDSSSSKGKEVALPIRDKAERESVADANMGDNEDADMIDAASVSSDNDDSGISPSESGDQRDEDGTARRSSPKGKGRALSISEGSSPEASIGARNRSNRVIQSIETDMDMDTDNSGSDNSGSNHSGSDNSSSDHSRDGDRTDEGSDGDGVIGRYDAFVQFQPPATVDPPVQEFRVHEDGTVDVRPEDAGEENSGRDGGADG